MKRFLKHLRNRLLHGQLRADMGDIKTDVHQLHSSVDGVKTDIHQLHSSVDGVKTGVHQLHSSVDSVKTDVHQLHSSVDDVKISLGNANKVIVDTNYITGEIVRRLYTIETLQREVNELKYSQPPPEFPDNLSEIKEISSSNPHHVSDLVKVDDDYYYIVQGKRHRKTSPFTKLELVSTGDYSDVPLSFPYAEWGHADFCNISSAWQARVFYSQFLHGVGLEFGAANNPMPSSPRNTVYYVDSYSKDEGSKAAMQDRDFVIPDIESSIDTFAGIDKTDYDFIVSSHVIEHTPKTLLAIKLAYEHLKPGGVFLAAVPHKDFISDMLRSETSLEHFINDFENYNQNDNIEHLREYYNTVSPEVFGNNSLVEMEKSLLAGNQLDMHYHVFTQNNFRQLIVWFNNNIYKWKKSYVYDLIPYKNCLEFWVLLVK